MKISEWAYFALLGAWILAEAHIHLLWKELKNREELLDYYREVVNAYYYKYGRYKGIPKGRVEEDGNIHISDRSAETYRR